MTQDQKKKFGDALMAARTQKQLTQLVCATHCGVSIVSYQNWERGVCEPKPAKRELICKFLGVNEEDFL